MDDGPVAEERSASGPAAPAPAEEGPARPCPLCRAENPPARTLCRRCAAPLAPPDRPPAPAAPELPWWRRLFRRRSPQRSLAAGSRPEHRPRRRIRLLWPVLLVALAVAAWLGRDQLTGLFDDAREQVSDLETLHPDQASASSEGRGHPAGAAFDGLYNRYWSPAEPGPAAGEYVRARFSEPIDLRALIVTPGSSVNQDEFIDQARPATLTLTLTDAAGEETHETISLRDEPGPQTFRLRASDVATITLTVDSAYGETEARHLALAEVEFFGHR